MRSLASFLLLSTITLTSASAYAEGAEPLARADQTRAAARVEPTPQAPAIKSPAMTIAGSIASGVGVATLIAGAVMWIDAENAADECYRDAGEAALFAGVGCALGETFPKITATGLFVTGGLHLAVGIPLIAVGASPRGLEDKDSPEVTFRLSAGRADLQVNF